MHFNESDFVLNVFYMCIMFCRKTLYEFKVIIVISKILYKEIRTAQEADMHK